MHSEAEGGEVVRCDVSGELMLYGPISGRLRGLGNSGAESLVVHLLDLTRGPFLRPGECKREDVLTLILCGFFVVASHALHSATTST